MVASFEWSLPYLLQQGTRITLFSNGVAQIPSRGLFPTTGSIQILVVGFSREAFHLQFRNFPTLGPPASPFSPLPHFLSSLLRSWEQTWTRVWHILPWAWKALPLPLCGWNPNHSSRPGSAVAESEQDPAGLLHTKAFCVLHFFDYRK